MKCADVVLDARELAATPRDAREGGMKANRWFNCACARRRETTRAMERDEAARDGGTRAVKELEGDSVDAFVEGAVTVDVYFERGGEARRRAANARSSSDGRFTRARTEEESVGTIISTRIWTRRWCISER